MGDLGDEEVGDLGTSDMRHSEIGRPRSRGIQRLGDLGDEDAGNWETSDMRRSEIGRLRR